MAWPVRVGLLAVGFVDGLLVRAPRNRGRQQAMFVGWTRGHLPPISFLQPIALEMEHSSQNSDRGLVATMAINIIGAAVRRR